MAECQSSDPERSTHLPWFVLGEEELELLTHGGRGYLVRIFSSIVQLPCLLSSAEGLQEASHIGLGRRGPHFLLFPPSLPQDGLVLPAGSSGVTVGGSNQLLLLRHQQPYFLIGQNQGTKERARTPMVSQNLQSQ